MDPDFNKRDSFRDDPPSAHDGGEWTGVRGSLENVLQQGNMIAFCPAEHHPKNYWNLMSCFLVQERSLDRKASLIADSFALRTVVRAGPATRSIRLPFISGSGPKK
jgi:hypothetical protein